MKARQRRRPKARLHPFDELRPISDEAASVIAQLLGDLHLQFEERFLGEIMRHHAATRPPPRDPRQPWLTGLPKPDETF